MNLTKFLKSGIIAVLILIVGLVLVCTVNFNRGYDFTGGTVITVNTTTYKTSEAYNKINKVLQNNQLSAYSIGEGENDNGVCIVVKYQLNNNLEKNEDVLNGLFTSFGYDKSNELETTYIKMVTETSPAYSSLVFSNAFLASLITLVAVAIYMFFRHNWTTGFAVILAGILDIGLMLSLTAITRLSISFGIAFSIITTLIFSIIMSFMQLNRMNRKAKDEEFLKAPNKQIADTCVKEGLFQNIVICVSFAIALLVLAILVGGSVWSSIASIWFGIISVFFTITFIVPTLWTISFEKKVRQPKKQQAVVVEEE